MDVADTSGNIATTLCYHGTFLVSLLSLTLQWFEVYCCFSCVLVHIRHENWTCILRRKRS